MAAETAESIKTVATALGGAGVGAVLLEVIRQFAARGNAQLADSAAVRQELFSRVDKLETRLELQRTAYESKIEALETRLDDEQAKSFGLKAQLLVMEAKVRDLEAQLARYTSQETPA